VGEWQVIERASTEAEASGSSSADAAVTVEEKGGRKRAAEGLAYEEDERGWKLRKKRLNVGLGEIYDPGVIAVKVKLKEEPQMKAEDVNEESTQLADRSSASASVKAELKWTPVKWRKASEVVETDETEHFIVENHRDYQQGTRSQTLGKKTHLVIEFRRGGVIQSDWFPNVEVLCQRRRINRNARVQTGRHGFRSTPFMADPKLAFRTQLDDVTAIYFHHLAQLGHHDFQKRIKIN